MIKQKKKSTLNRKMGENTQNISEQVNKIFNLQCSMPSLTSLCCFVFLLAAGIFFSKISNPRWSQNKTNSDLLPKLRVICQTSVLHMSQTIPNNIYGDENPYDILICRSMWSDPWIGLALYQHSQTQDQVILCCNCWYIRLHHKRITSCLCLKCYMQKLHRTQNIIWM